jgi:hypothetical protein
MPETTDFYEDDEPLGRVLSEWKKTQKHRTTRQVSAKASTSEGRAWTALENQIEQDACRRLQIRLEHEQDHPAPLSPYRRSARSAAESSASPSARAVSAGIRNL